MQSLYPAGPAGVPATLTRPTPAYRRHAWLAMGGLGVFVVFYIALSGWFLWTAWRLLSGLSQGNDFSLWTLLAGACAAFLALFMLKALFFVKHGHESDDIEVRRGDEPQLFEFLDRLADEAGAPRPHRVFLSPRVNAAVFYDLSILNLLFPSRKNLEIGLGLVNVLTLGELKAVLAHEFGHFAQKTMAVGRWVYIAQQIASHVISRRDALDKFLAGLSRVDLRVAWVGWLLSLVVWSIRSLMETVFRLVIIGERALSREMELQADLVAVSLTGSDALIHALHKLGAADQAWDRALGFVGSEIQQGRSVRDVFAVQLRILEQMRTILGDPQFGMPPVVPQAEPQAHRVFRNELAQPPRMWATHPANSEREANAKRVYVAAQIDARSAWDLFADSRAVRESMSTHLARNTEAKLEPQAVDDCLRKLDEQYGRAFLDRTYRGAYLGRSVVRHVATAEELYGVRPAAERIVDELAALYPPELSEDLELWRRLEEERGALEALRAGVATASGGVIRHGGRELKRHELPQVIADLGVEIAAVAERVNNHDRRCRTAHLTAAEGLGGGWAEYLRGLLAILHYSDHAEANLHDAHGFFGNTFAVVTADGKVSSREMQRLVEAVRVLYTALEEVQDPAASIVLDRTLLRRLNVESWRACLEELKLPPPTQENLQGWLNHVDGWVASATQSLSSLRLAALEQLLLAEAQVARFVRSGMKPAEAPPPSQVPRQYVTLVPGKERPRQRKLGLWDRFQIADGLWPMMARLVVAGAIIGGVFVAAGAVGESTVVVYNGLGRAVEVAIGETRATIGAFRHTQLQVPQEQTYRVSARVGEAVLEAFEAEADAGFSRYVYNVAGAAPMVEWTASYGTAANIPDRPLGAPRWTTTSADVLFEEPPEQLRGEKGETRRVLAGLGDAYPPRALALLDDDAQRNAILALHARWDDSRSRYGIAWVTLARPLADFPEILAARLADNPHDVVNLRLEQDLADEATRVEVCRRHTQLAAGRADSADLQYIGARCIQGEALKDEKFLELHSRWPRHGWLSMAAGYAKAGQAKWLDALPLLQAAHRSVPPLADSLAVDIARINRVVAPDDVRFLRRLEPSSEHLQYLQALELSAQQPGPEWALPYHALARGDLERAIAAARGANGDEERITRLAAASDGADAALVERAFALPMEAGLDDMTVWSMLGLALRTGRDAEPYAKRALELGGDGRAGAARAALDFIAAVRGNTNPVAAERALRGVMPHVRGQAYLAVTVALGTDAPRQWRETAKRLLFTAERPYLR